VLDAAEYHIMVERETTRYVADVGFEPIKIKVRLTHPEYITVI
jgi:hypothetical protein